MSHAKGTIGVGAHLVQPANTTTGAHIVLKSDTAYLHVVSSWQIEIEQLSAKKQTTLTTTTIKIASIKTATTIALTRINKRS